MGLRPPPLPPRLELLNDCIYNFNSGNISERTDDMRTRTFRIEPHHRKLISKSTLLKALTLIDRGGVETPALLIDRGQVQKKVRAIGSNIRNSTVYYAVKANPAVEVLGFLNELGMGFEIASEGELRILSELGVPPGKIISSNPVKSFRFLSAAADYGIEYMAVDSEAEVNKIAELAPGTKVYVRLSVPNEGSEWPLSHKFGLELDDSLALARRAAQLGLEPAGITFHVGSQCTNLYNWNTAIYKARVLWEMAEKEGLGFSVLNIGGGYPINYTKNVIDIEEIEKNVDRLIFESFPPETRVFIEPGRAVVGDAGILVSTVLGKARRADEDWLYIDVGVFNGLMESLGGIRYSYIVEEPAGGGDAPDGGGGVKKLWTLTGPSCDSFDVIEKNVALHEPDVGGLVLVLSSGAYTVSYASEFNGFSIPTTTLI